MLLLCALLRSFAPMAGALPPNSGPHLTAHADESGLGAKPGATQRERAHGRERDRRRKDHGLTVTAHGLRSRMCDSCLESRNDEDFLNRISFKSERQSRTRGYRNVDTRLPAPVGGFRISSCGQHLHTTVQLIDLLSAPGSAHVYHLPSPAVVRDIVLRAASATELLNLRLQHTLLPTAATAM